MSFVPWRRLTIVDMETILQANGVDLCVETFGAPADPAILLVHGASASMLWWEEELCERLAAGGRYVIRFDHRDTGRSVSYPAGQPEYALHDMADDAVGILDALGVERAHFVGRSMAGGIVALAAVRDPARVASLTMVTTSPGGDDLPPMSDELTGDTGAEPPDPADSEAVVEFIVALTEVYAGGSPHYDESAMRALVQRDVARTTNVAACLTNHYVIDVGTPVDLGEIAAPTLVVHGERDPVFPLGHGQAMKERIPGADLLVLQDTGHDVPPPVWDVFVPALLAHTAG